MIGTKKLKKLGARIRNCKKNLLKFAKKALKICPKALKKSPLLPKKKSKKEKEKYAWGHIGGQSSIFFQAIDI